MTHRLVLSLALFGLAATLFGILALRSQDAAAIAPCTPHTNTSEEWTMLDLVQDFRDGRFNVSPHLTMSAPLNKAAKGYANLLAQTPGSGGHTYDGAQPWDRALACGFATRAGQAVGGEGLAIFTGSGSAQAALQQMQNHQGSGIYVPASHAGGAYLTKCAGVAKATGNGRTIWVVLLFATSSSSACPEPVSPQVFQPTNTPTIPPPSATATATTTSPSVTPASPSATETTTAEPTETATVAPPTTTPTETVYRNFSPNLSRAD